MVQVVRRVAHQHLGIPRIFAGTRELTVSHQHYIGGTHERVHRVMRERAGSMIREQMIYGQVAMIITERHSKRFENPHSTKISGSVSI